MPNERTCPYTQSPCRFECSDTGEYCFQMRQMCHEQIREGHAQFGKVAPFEEEPPTSAAREQGNLEHKGASARSGVKPHAKLHGKVYFQGIDKRQLNPSPEHNEEAARNAEELQLRHGLRHRYHHTPKPSPY